jgi:hypothetical protein
MAKFNEEMVKAGVMLDGNGLQPSSKGARVRFSGSVVRHSKIGSPNDAVGVNRDWQIRCPRARHVRFTSNSARISAAQGIDAEGHPTTR